MDEFEKASRKKWKLMSKSILREQKGKSEVQKILKHHFHVKHEEKEFLKDMTSFKKFKKIKFKEDNESDQDDDRERLFL